MKAVWFDEFGAAADVLQYGEQPTPELSANDVLVRIVTSGVNPSDVKKRAGAFADLLDGGLVIPHSDGAGVIEAVGSNVSNRQPGDRVWIYQAQYARRFGTAAQYVVVNEERAPLLPSNAEYGVGACLGIPAMTAHRCVFSNGNVDGQTILVTGGAGRVGYYAIQWASEAGATVVATASNDADEKVCREAGAIALVNHRDPNWSVDAVSASNGKKFSRVIDVEFGANLPQVLDLIQTSGRIISYASMTEPQPQLPFLRMMYLDLTVQLVIVYAMPEEAKRQAVADIEQFLHQGRLQHRIAARYPLADAVKAHEKIEQGKCRGCVILDID